MEKIELAELHSNLNSSYDVFIASASYEERSFSISDNILGKIHFTHKLVSVSLPHRELISQNEFKFVNDYGFTPIGVDNSKQLFTAENLMQPIGAVLTQKPDASFLIDITTFTRQTLLILLRLLRNVLKTTNTLHLVYSPASEYSIGLPLESKWLTKGVLGVSSVYGYAGLMRPSGSYHLIILMGYEVERAMCLIEYYEPAKITIGYARQVESMSDELYKLNKHRFEQLKDEYPLASHFEFSCRDVNKCRAEILEVVNSHKGYNTVLSPMNNKISTVSCALAAYENTQLQIAIANPALYNSANYSNPSDYGFIVDSSLIIRE